MGLFSGFGSNNRKITNYEYSKSGGVRSRIMSRLSGSFGKKKEKMAELDNAIRPSMDHGGRTKFDDGVDKDELESTVANLRAHHKELDLDEGDIKAVEEELRKKL